MKHRVGPVSGLLPFLLIFLLSSAPAFAQEDDFSVFAPFVSKLRIAVRDPLVRITWEDIPEIETRYQVYRHTREINSASFASASLAGEVAAGVQVLLDEPDQPGQYYYAVLALDPSGNPYRIFIPLRNISLISVAIDNVSTPLAQADPASIEEDPQIAAVTEVQPQFEGLSNLRVVPRPDNQALTISYQTDILNQRVSIYRATRPIMDSESLSSAILVATQEDSLDPRVLDYVVPGVSYYYAVLDADSLAADGANLAPGKTSLEEPVSLPLGNQAVLRGSLFASGPRNPGLPLLNPNTSFVSGRQLPPPVTNSVPEAREASTRAMEAFQVLASPFPPSRESSLSPRILEIDQLAELLEDKAEARILESILRTEFDGQDWERTTMLLENLLTLPLDADRRARVEFYLGQSRYFAGNLEQAFLTFLLVRDDLGPAVVEPWMDLILRTLFRA